MSKDKEKELEEIFGNDAEELSDALEDFSDFDDESSFIVNTDSEDDVKKSPVKLKQRRASPIGSPSILEGDRDEDAYFPAPSSNKRRKKPEQSRVKRQRKRTERIENPGDLDEDVAGNVEPALAPLMASKAFVDRDFDEILPKRKGRSKKTDIELDKMYDDVAMKVYQRMMEAGEKDHSNNTQGVHASERNEILSWVMDKLEKAYLRESLLEHNILDAIRLWLEPLPDRSLPSHNIQEDLLKSLNDVKFNFGRIVYFYSKSPRINFNIQRQAQQLVDKWAGPINGQSNNYREKIMRMVHEANSGSSFPVAGTFDAIPTIRGGKRDDPYKNIKRTMARLRRTGK
ncbi:701_t:CDS:2 [Funneliformis caledonium]|uniref:701_t:CDS:1 n=1 Tax=Funneliformis caledonium TaxID=1117310 RepID=A0A9N9DFN0_9GLOM|nr:701_t:CDS:2 [Funneliformis caledonium]